MKRTSWIFALLAAIAPSAFAAYTPYFTDALTSFQSAYWTGSLSPGVSGMMLSKVAVPDGTSSYDIKMTVNGSGTYDLLLRATANANPTLGCNGTGGVTQAYYDVRFATSGSNMNVSIMECLNANGLQVLTSTTVSGYSPGTTIRAMINDNGYMVATMNGQYVLSTQDYTIATGVLGISFSGAGANVQLGPADRVVPVSLPSITYSAFPTSVNFSGTGSAADDTNGVGIVLTQWRRNGLFMANTGATWSDTTVQSGQEYVYSFTAYDGHWNALTTSFTITIPNSPAGSPTSPDGHQTGIRTTGTYWGGGQEQIDVLSGNVNYTLPLINPISRNGLAAKFNLTYNSQNWRSDSGGLWNLGADVGYGYGWKLLAGAITPVYSGATLSYYNFYDSTGASYRLNVNNSGVWSSLESVYVWLDTNVSPNKLHFRDGSFWILGSTSASGEQDAGSLYPTTMESTDGNQILIIYQQGVGGSTTNTSARITSIQDSRVGTIPTYAYVFSYTYTGGTTPYHLSSITNGIGTAEAYGVTLTAVTLQAPFSPYTSYGTTYLLTGIDNGNIPYTALTHQTFTYSSDNSGALTQATTGLGGYQAWSYHNVTYTTGATFREVQTRSLSKDGVGVTNYPFSHETSTLNLHSYTIIDDPGGVGEKYWAFSLSGANTGMVTQYQGRKLPGPVALTQNDFTWAQDANGNLFIRSALTTQDPGQTYQAQKRTDQDVDIYGNVTTVLNFDYNSLTTPARSYNYTYLTGSNYSSRYIFNRLTQAKVSTGGVGTLTLATITYDPGYTALPTGSPTPTVWDSSYSTITYRGHIASSTTLSGTTSYYYDVLGSVKQTTVNGVTSNVTSSTSNNYAVPSQITVGSLSDSMSWTSFLGLSSNTGSNSDTGYVSYDGYGRPSYSTAVSGAITAHVYSTGPTYSSSSPAWNEICYCGQVGFAMLPDARFTKNILDGLGRTLTTQTGTVVPGTFTLPYGPWGTNTVISQVDTVYDSCGCSPLGKMIKQSLPHAPGGTVYYTIYSYDGIGRTLSVLKPDGASTTTYSYAGNSVTTTDPAGKWKTYTMDAFGNVTQVVEPNPAGGANFVTTYTYDSLGHLVRVSMPRPYGAGTYAQTRTFVYNGNDLMQVTNPENGTVAYTYDSNHKLVSRTDAKGQQTVYTYGGSLNSVVEEQHFKQVSGSWVEDTTQQVLYYYDSNPLLGGYTNYAVGRLAARSYSGAGGTVQESFNYDPSGNVLGKSVNIAPPGGGSYTMAGAWTYDIEGRVTGTTYPAWNNVGTPIPGSSFIYGYDTSGRLNTMSNGGYGGASLISGVTYNIAGEQTAIAGALFNETRSYNTMFQLSQITVPGALNIQYSYSATQNNGKITSQTDVISGETVVYTYDALNRLATAQTSAGSPTWGQSYTYDGWGNLTDQNVILGSAPTMHVAYNPATNRQTGDVADANGNIGSSYTYDMSNRLIQASGTSMVYAYAPDNKRVWRGDGSSTNEYTFWTPGGQKLATYTPTMWGLSLTSANVYFGSRLIAKGVFSVGGGNDSSGYVLMTSVASDRLGSIGKFYPYGQERPSATANDKEKFTGYYRDAATGLDYADQRYHQPGVGRFMTADPAPSSAQTDDPGSQNRYAYTRGDPVNRTDPSGLEDDGGDDCGINPFDFGCYSGGGGMRFFAVTAFARATDRLNDARNAIDNMDSSSTAPNCQADLDALSKASGDSDISIASIQGVLDSTDFKDGTTSQLPVSALYGSAVAAGASYQRQQDRKYGKGQTIAKEFARNPNGLSADTVLNGSTIFINPALITNNLWGNEGLLLHEALHELGLQDGQIQKALGFSEDPKNTKNISTKLQHDCVI
jgi:RHS repeat-associated protein